MNETVELGAWRRLSPTPPSVPLNEDHGPEGVRRYGRLLATVHTVTNEMPFAPERPCLDFHTLVAQPLSQLEATLYLAPRVASQLR